MLLIIMSIVTTLTAYYGYIVYRAQFEPSYVYGEWIEIGTPHYDTERLMFDQYGVKRDNKRIATGYDFDGKEIIVNTGRGRQIYRLTGNSDSPQLQRIHPRTPVQQFVKAGFEHTVERSADAVSTRREAVSSHFRNQK
ncbi:DUF2850 domain-containing protein [Vibrio sp. SM6]|uniref:DUF2850 domain-containing protein n=2 Tax=Vibrio agarilyticus TaxID=2726741 RepID=A0A7X8TPL2_9VIBR|nr:DUF2850 domain-containing protein [Vibrio agarilyticus]